MGGAHGFLMALAVVLGVAALTTVAFRRLRQPVVLGYILAGVIVGPHVPVPLVADREIVQTLSELGVILLMFTIGLSFSLRRLAQVGLTAGLTALVETCIMVWLGFVTGQAFGWTVLESIFAGAVIAISSTTIVAKAFDELGIRGKIRELVVGVLVVEDLIAVLLMAVLTALAKGSGLSAGGVALTIGRLVLFLGLLLGAGMLIVPRAVRWVRRLGRPETTLVASLGLCFGVALLADRLGYSVALGAFIAGSLVAESGEERHVERLVQPVRDMFAAVFFVSVGMLMDPELIARHWAAVAVFAAVVVVGKIGGVGFGAFLTGQGTRTSIQTGMSLAQIGEFSFIIAALGLSLGATRDFLYPIAVSVSAVTTLTTPWLIRSSGAVASFVDRKLPRPLQTVAVLYASWVERIRASPQMGTATGRVRRLGRVLAVDAAAITGIVVATALGVEGAVRFLGEHLGVGRTLTYWAILGAAALATVPLGAGVVRNARRMGVALAAAALPEGPQGQTDLAAAPRRALTLSLQLATVIVTGVPILALTQPFVHGVAVVVVVALMVAVLGVAFWRGATNLEGHVRAGAQIIVEVLARQGRGPGREERDVLVRIAEVLPGIGDPVVLKLAPRSPAVGRTLAQLDLRGLTGATVLAIWRPEGGVMVPSAKEVLRAGDVLALAGSGEAVAAAREMLESRPVGAARESADAASQEWP